MVIVEHPPASPRLSAALHELAVTFRGMTARPDEHNCECHWGSRQELAQLKQPDTELEPDLLRRTWEALDWTNHASVLHRILPQFANALVGGLVESHSGLARAGRSLAFGGWQTWPDAHAAAVREFLAAWWVHSLTDPAPAIPAHRLLAFLAEASGRLDPWLHTWEELSDPIADQYLAEAVDHWSYHLLTDALPWNTYDDEDATRAELTAWLIRHAPERLRAHGADGKLRHRVRLLALTGPERWDDPHWPDFRP